MAWGIIGSMLPHLIVWALAALILVVTVLPLLDTTVWWIRVMDFPRLQIAIAGAVVLAGALALSGPTRVVIPVLMAIACGYHLWRISPYTIFAPVEMTLAPEGPHTVRILSSNVLMENDRHDLLRAVIDRVDPDILLLMETDETWIAAMEPVLDRYSTILREPMDNHYGMLFATRLPVDDARIVRLTNSDTPSVFAALRAPDGTRFRFVGLHPRPPVPGQSTEERDAQIHYAARFASRSGTPMVVTGDFNDVAWSDTSRTFKHVGRYLDPRIGRGFFASFDANRPYLRFPIDQLFVTADAAVVSIERQGHIGSDHFPMAATISLDSATAARLNGTPRPVSEEEQRRIDASVARTRESLGHAKF